MLNIATKFIPDPQAKAASALEMARMQQVGEIKEQEASLQLRADFVIRTSAPFPL